MKSQFKQSSDSTKSNYSDLINRFLLLLILLFIQPGCNPVEVEHPGKFVSGEPFELKVRDIMSINDNLLFAIDSIHDGRCPVGLNCFWSGDAYLYFKIKHNYSFIDTIICMNSCHTNPFDFAGYTFKVLDVTPYPDINIKIDPEGIKIKMVVTEN